MDFIDEIRKLSEKALDQQEGLKTEEATKNALVMPFISLLGYDVFDPREVVPEYTADVGIKKGEKVDYAIFKDGSPAILFECKAAGVALDGSHANQLHRYFSAVQAARFGVLTNGIAYRFFSDIEDANRMDAKPFLELNLLDIRESLVDELKKFAKESFDVDNMLSTARELKYTREIKHILAAQYELPTKDFVRFCIEEVYFGSKTQTVLEQFVPITKRAFEQFVKDHINERPKPPLEGEDDGKIVTTEEQRKAFFVVKSILDGVVDPSRVAIRPVQTYCGILLDDNARKPICRLHFNRSQKYLKIFTFDGTDRKETQVPIDSINDIYQYADHLKSVCRSYDGASSEEI